MAETASEAVSLGAEAFERIRSAMELELSRLEVADALDFIDLMIVELELEEEGFGSDDDLARDHALERLQDECRSLSKDLVTVDSIGMTGYRPFEQTVKLIDDVEQMLLAARGEVEEIGREHYRQGDPAELLAGPESIADKIDGYLDAARDAGIDESPTVDIPQAEVDAALEEAIEFRNLHIAGADGEPTELVRRRTQDEKEASEEAGVRIRVENAAAKRDRIMRRMQNGG